MRIIKRVISRPVKLIGQPLQDGLIEAKTLKSRFKSILNEMRSNRDPDADGAPDLDDFQAVLDHWQIDRKQIGAVTKSLNLRATLFGLLGLAGLIITAAGIYQSRLILLFDGTILVILATVAWTTTKWRIQVLKNQRFVPFRQWITNKGDTP